MRLFCVSYLIFTFVCMRFFQFFTFSLFHLLLFYLILHEPALVEGNAQVDEQVVFLHHAYGTGRTPQPLEAEVDHGAVVEPVRDGQTYTHA